MTRRQPCDNCAMHESLNSNALDCQRPALYPAIVGHVARACWKSWRLTRGFCAFRSIAVNISNFKYRKF